MENIIKSQISSVKQSLAAISEAESNRLTMSDWSIVCGLIVVSFLCGFAITDTVLRLIN